MTTPRRRVLRPPAAVTDVERRNHAALRRYEAKLAAEQVAFRRWMKRLKRCFTAVDKHQRGMSRIEKQLTLLRQV
jgi:hypothetical protein